MTDDIKFAFCAADINFIPFFMGNITDEEGNAYEDFHGFIASHLYNIPIKDVSIHVKNGETIQPLYWEDRQMAKQIFFAWLYGAENPEIESKFPGLVGSRKNLARLFEKGIEEQGPSRE